jgi:DNA-binding CsgD family transcriptional regulator
VRATAEASRTAEPRIAQDAVETDAAVAAGALAGSDDPMSAAVRELRRAVRALLHLQSGTDGGVLVRFDVDGLSCQVVVQDEPVEPAGVSLSPREEEIVRMVARGCTNRMIASVLDISEWTVGTHLRRVFTKLDVNSRAAMVARLFAEGDRRRTPE